MWIPLLVPMRSAPASIISLQLSHPRMPPEALTFTFFPAAAFIRRTSSALAPAVPNPVLVLMKSGYTREAIWDALQISRFVR